MSSIALPAVADVRPTPIWRHGRTVLVLVACALFMFAGSREPPLALWDESRIAVNALEMHLSGHPSLVATYGFAPDLWNTKPPLLIWLMDLSMSLFGVSEWSLRLPSVLAAMGTLALTLSFARRLSGSFWTGALAAGLLATSILFFGEHGARTADYEALLCLFTTGYLYVLFFALHRRRPGWRAPVLAGGLIAAAVMTKSIAGLLPGIGVPLYLALVGRWRRPLQAPWLLATAPVSLAAPAAFYTLREHAAPGFLRAVLYNDLSGRYTRALDRHAGPPWYYLDRIVASGGFSGAWLAVLAPAGLVVSHRRLRLGLLYSLCVCAGLLGVLSFSATKLVHYAAPAIPFFAIATALALHSGAVTLGRARAEGRVGRGTQGVAIALGAGLLALGAARSAYFRVAWLPQTEFQGAALYGALFDRLAARGASRVHVVDGGVVTSGVEAAGVPADYAPQLDFYRELAVSRGQDVTRVSMAAASASPRGVVLASCDPRFTPSLAAYGPDLADIGGCVAVRR